MATAKLIETHKVGADVFTGDACKAKVIAFLDEIAFPKDILPVDEVEEIGINRSTRFIWLRLKKKKEQKFPMIRMTTVMYNIEITGFFEKGHMSKMSGVKAKELLLPVVISDILVGVPTPDRIKFTTPFGLSLTHPFSAFQLEDK